MAYASTTLLTGYRFFFFINMWSKIKCFSQWCTFSLKTTFYYNCFSLFFHDAKGHDYSVLYLFLLLMNLFSHKKGHIVPYNWYISVVSSNSFLCLTRFRVWIPVFRISEHNTSLRTGSLLTKDSLNCWWQLFNYCLMKQRKVIIESQCFMMNIDNLLFGVC